MFYGDKMVPKEIFDRAWSRDDLDLWPQNLISSYLPQMHQTFKFGEIHPNSLQEIVLTIFRTYTRTDSPRT